LASAPGQLRTTPVRASALQNCIKRGLDADCVDVLPRPRSQRIRRRRSRYTTPRARPPLPGVPAPGSAAWAAAAARAAAAAGLMTWSSVEGAGLGLDEDVSDAGDDAGAGTGAAAGAGTGVPADADTDALAKRITADVFALAAGSRPGVHAVVWLEPALAELRGDDDTATATTAATAGRVPAPATQCEWTSGAPCA
jgi:hypothetical protein